MKLRFEIDQAQYFRRGVDAPVSIVTIDVNPAALTVDERNLIADHLDGIDVVKLEFVPTKGTFLVERGIKNRHIMAAEATLPALLAALHQHENDLEDAQRSYAQALHNSTTELTNRIVPGKGGTK